MAAGPGQKSSLRPSISNVVAIKAAIFIKINDGITRRSLMVIASPPSTRNGSVAIVGHLVIQNRIGQVNMSADCYPDILVLMKQFYNPAGIDMHPGTRYRPVTGCFIVSIKKCSSTYNRNVRENKKRDVLRGFPEGAAVTRRTVPHPDGRYTRFRLLSDGYCQAR